MSDRVLLLEALSSLCNAPVQSSAHGRANLATDGFIRALMGRSPSACRQGLCIDMDEFFDPTYDYDFTDVTDKGTYYRGGEVYERPCGWKRYAVKVLNKYQDGNQWLGNRGHCTTFESVPGEWPVSYHGTSEAGAAGIIISHYQPGPGAVYGRGIYSTPYIAEALPYTKTFVSASTGHTFRVVLQNRVNPAYREKHNNGKYWLVRVDKSLTQQQEVELVEKAIRPYSVLLKKV